MLGLELVVVLGIAVLLGSMAAHRYGIPAPVFLLLIGVLLGFMPMLGAIRLPPVVVLLLFLPALLYWESLSTSLREIRSNLVLVAVVTVGLVIATAAAVAAVAHALGMPWTSAWVLGGAIAPTDAAAMAALARNLPRRLVHILRAESLINDGTALVIYSLAVEIAVGQQRPQPAHILGLFLLSYAGGAAAGLVTAWLSVRVRRLLDAPLLENTVSLMTPFTAFLLAELIHASGVLAVVVCGLALSQVGPRVVRADTRTQSFAFWSLSTFALNAALFVLVGLQLPTVVRDLLSTRLRSAVAGVAVVSAVILGVRFACLLAAGHLQRWLDRLTGRPTREIYASDWVIGSMAGFRGAVSLAAALAIPERLHSGAPFPFRDTIIFVTAGVIVVTLLLQGSVLPLVVRRTRAVADTTLEDERHLAETVATEEALAAMDKIAADRGIDRRVVDRMRTEYEKHLRVLRAHGDEKDPNPGRCAEADFRSLRLGLLNRKRQTVVRLRDEQRIDDTALRQIQAQLDAEEIRLSRRDLPE
ncbi:Na+/H+ antiporter [Planosporangium flavigriseum]|uniref:Putative Na(+)/H(+) exchanger n=1 Tax=Planosporangium flavigriseum TaxID=373681 RepID=A0A8J3PPV8_9ACTN|nr:Na+/H+ antiporter [Planosporangium flavigriseum]NJC66462.1 Na+/H+ antiporter [Planosporangium flavigriseum]GIG76774.1 putative Na(+)/H(+) exchanger [Planosporangium flavigriseum]